LHSHGEIDIHSCTVAFTCTDLSFATKEDLIKIVGIPKFEHLARLDGKPLDKALPKSLVEATEWDHWAGENIEDIRIIDLGEGFPQGMKPASRTLLGPLKAPETVFEGSFDHRVDLWRAGCVASCPTHFAESWY
jgi:serine/threonine-protein kinase SRPK3